MLFGEMPVTEFLTDYWQKQPLCIRAAMTAAETIVSPQQLFELAEDDRLVGKGRPGELLAVRDARCWQTNGRLARYGAELDAEADRDEVEPVLGVTVARWVRVAFGAHCPPAQVA